MPSRRLADPPSRRWPWKTTHILGAWAAGKSAQPQLSGQVGGRAPTLDGRLEEAGGGQKLEEVVGRGEREEAGCWKLKDEGNRRRYEMRMVKGGWRIEAG